jgi:GH24 family phage-related lysozyme (muramidase)
MPINKIIKTKRGQAAIAAAIAASMAGAGALVTRDNPPPAVVLATDSLIKPWEGLVLTAHYDTFAKIYDICHGETLINGKPVKPGMKFTPQQCDDILKRRVYDDYYLPIMKCAPNLKNAPISVQASAISGAYNFGVGGWCGSSMARKVRSGEWRAACEAQTAWNKAGGQIVGGLVRRREMGDAQRLGEAELCVSGL